MLCGFLRLSDCQKINNKHAELVFEQAKESLIESIRVVHRLSEEEEKSII